MRRRFVPLVIALLVFAPPAAAQDTDNGGAATQAPVAPQAESFLDKYAAEWMFTAGASHDVVVFNSAGGHRFGLQSVSWARVLTEPHLPGPLRGRFAWAFEVIPVFGQYEPTGVYGFGVSPLVWRWNFEPRGRFAPYGELAGGGLWTTGPVPDSTTTANFTAHAGGGLRYLFRPHQAIVITWWFHHISNGNRIASNPGVNSHVVQVGFSYIRPPKHRRGRSAADEPRIDADIRAGRKMKRG